MKKKNNNKVKSKPLELYELAGKKKHFFRAKAGLELTFLPKLGAKHGQ
jgi:hypothetical protein